MTRLLALLSLLLLCACSSYSPAPARRYREVPLDAWVKQLKDPDPDQRIQAIEALQQLAAAVPAALTRAMKDPDPFARGFAVQAVIPIHRSLGETNGALAKVLARDPKLSNRLLAAQSLGFLGAPPVLQPDLSVGQPYPYKPVTCGVKQLLAALDSPEPLLRGSAAQALGLLGNDALVSLAELEAEKSSPDKADPGHGPPSRVEQALERHTTDPDPLVSSFAKQALARIYGAPITADQFQQRTQLSLADLPRRAKPSR